VADAVESVRDDRSEMRGVLRVVTSVNVSPHVLPPLLRYFVQAFPEVTVQTSEASIASLHEALRTGNADLGVCYAWQSSPDFHETLVEDVRQHVMLPSGHALAGRDRIHLREVIDEPLVMIDIPPSVERILQLIVGLGLTPDLRWTSGNFETIRSMVAHGLGWSFVNLTPRSNTTYDGLEVAYVPIADEIPTNPLVVITPKGDEPTARVREAVRYLVERRGRMGG